MTIKQRLLAFVGFQPGEYAADAALLDQSLEPADDYEPEMLPAVRLAAISLLETILSTPNTSNNVTGFSVTYDRGAVERRLASLKKEAGIKEGAVIRAVSW